MVNSIHNATSHGKSGTYNIASEKIITIKELAELILSISRKKLKIIHVIPKKGDIIHSQSDIALAKINLKYHPKFELREGIRELQKF